MVMTSSSGEKKFVVKHKYEAAQKDELTLKPGEIVVLVEDVEPGWAHGKVLFVNIFTLLFSKLYFILCYP